MINKRGYVKWKKRLAADVYWLGIGMTEPSELDFKAGQFISLQVGSAASRNYSICSSPVETEQFEICINTRSNGTGSKYIQSLDKDEDCAFSGPGGQFVIEEGEKPLLFLATGTGLSPIRSMLLDLNFRADKREKMLLFGVRNEKDLFWEDELERMKIMDTKFDYTIWLSRPSPAWLGRCGRITEGLKAIKNIVDYDVYICGNPEMVESMKMLLVGQGLQDDAIHFEKFVPFKS